MIYSSIPSKVIKGLISVKHEYCHVKGKEKEKENVVSENPLNGLDS